MNIIKEIQQLKKRVNALYCNLIGAGGVIEIDPTVPDYVKAITQDDIINWETTTDAEVIITENTEFATINDSQKIFNKNISKHILTYSDPNKANINADNILNDNVYLWITALDLYTKSDIDSKFYNNSTETVTEINKPTLLNNILTIKYKGENGVVQTQTVDLSTLVTVDIHIEDAVYDPANNIITITDTEGNKYNVNLSEFSILKTVTAQGITKLIQEGETKLEVSKVGTTGKYADIIEKPFFLEVPENVGTWVIHVSDLGNYYYVDANGFGKNIANSHLQTTQQGALTQNYDFKWTYGDRTLTLGTDSTNTEGGYSSFMSFAKYLIHANVSNPTLGSNTYFNLNLNQAELRVHETGIQIWRDRIELLNASTLLINMLADKSNDSTYNKLLGINAAGNVAKVDGKIPFKNFISNLSPTEALEIAQLLNGGSGSVGAMSVNLISPPIIQKIDSNEYIMLRGVNLNLNATAKKIEILDSTSRVVIATVPDNQIQLYANGLELIFFYNFKDIPYGKYVIRLTSGVKVYETTLTLSVVSTVNLINTNTITWEIQNSVTVPAQMVVSQGGGSLYLEGSATTTNSPVIAFKSSEIFAQGEDFYLEINITAGNNPGGNGSSDQSIRNNIGLGYSSTVNTLLDNTLIKTAMGHYETIGIDVYNNAQGVYHNLGPYSYTVIFIKTGNLFRTIIGSTNQSVILSNNSGYSIFINLKRLKSNFNSQFSIIKAYTFN